MVRKKETGTDINKNYYEHRWNLDSENERQPSPRVLLEHGTGFSQVLLGPGEVCAVTNFAHETKAFWPPDPKTLQLVTRSKTWRLIRHMQT